MRKFYFLLLLLTGTGFLFASAQDHANFTFTINKDKEVHFTNTSTTSGDVSRKAVWSFGDGQSATTSAKEGTEHEYKAAGKYTVCLKIYKAVGTDFALSAQECKEVVISPSPVENDCKADFSSEPSAASPLVRRFVAIPSQSAQKKPIRICWKFGDGKEECKEATTSAPVPLVSEHVYSKAGQYEVCVTIKYDGGCEAKFCKIVTVNAPPPPTTCELKFAAFPVSASAYKRTFIATTMTNRVAEKICWTYGDGKESCVTLPNPSTQQSLTSSHTYTAPGIYHVCAKVMYAGGCTAEACHEVVIKANNKNCGGELSSVIKDDRTVEFHGSGIANTKGHITSYRWNFGDGTSGTGEDIKHTYSTSGRYEVCLVLNTDFGCETRICKQIEIGETHEPAIKLSPNPVKEELHISFRSNRQEMVTIAIYNVNGLIMKTFQRLAAAGQNNWGIDVSTLPNGVYSVIVRSPNQLSNALFSKQ